MKISELKPKMSGVNAEFEVVEKGDVREFNKFGKSGRVCNAVVQDDSGKIKLSLWNEDCDRISLGDKLKLTEGYVNEYQGELQLTSGRSGKLEVVGKGSGDAPAKAVSKPAPALKTNFASKKGLDGNDTEEEPDDEDDLGDDDDDVDEEFVE
jgi:replication factor A1